MVAVISPSLVSISEFFLLLITPLVPGLRPVCLWLIHVIRQSAAHQPVRARQTGVGGNQNGCLCKSASELLSQLGPKASAV